MPRKFPQFGYNPVTGEWNDSLAGEFLWSNVNVSEAVPDVMTPSTWSLWWIYHYETNPVEFPGDYTFCGNICGRSYLNLSLIVSLYRSVGKDVRKELQADLLGSTPAELDIPFIPFSPFRVLWKVLLGMVKAHQNAWRDNQKINEFLSTVPGWCQTMRMAIRTCQDRSSLLSLWQESIKPGVVRACKMLRSVTMALADPATKLHADLTTLVGGSETNAILSNLSGAAADLESLGPLMGLAQVQAGRLSREAYQERFGHRGPHEMELFAPGPDEDPGWFERRLAAFAQSPADVEGLFEKQRSQHLAAWADFERRFPAKARSIRPELDKVAAAAKNREAVRSEATRIAQMVRSFLLRAGEITGLGDDIFFLSLDEMTRVLAGDDLAVLRIPARREAYQREVALPPYPAIITGCFDPYAWAADPNRRGDYFDSRQVKPGPIVATITGLAVTSGSVEGIVRRLDRPEDGSQLQPGEILVTTSTNVGWTLLFPRLAAIVTDVGAPLSHAAIVARELGIPAVVGCGNATTRLKTGDRVRVDGGRGVVELIDMNR